ncbi:MAG: DUF1176 domain-containing protein [Candidatus Accumulibacter sp.]|jgi:hypothetical protein|nr:DUF1176 domain-containing protein [Accumulibacter sp.]
MSFIPNVIGRLVLVLYLGLNASLVNAQTVASNEMAAIACPLNRSMVHISFDPWGECQQQDKKQVEEKNRAIAMEKLVAQNKAALERRAVGKQSTVTEEEVKVKVKVKVKEAEKTESQASTKLPAPLPVCPKGLHYYHHDWELACDNTCTCRAAGYQSESDEQSVLLLLTRKAGPNEHVTGQLMISGYEETPVARLPSTFEVSLYVNGQMIGEVKIRRDSLVADLGAKEISALLRALLRDSEIGMISGDANWRLSDKGAAAVLLKMDEYQGRIGTPGALVRKGKRNEHTVFAPLPVPVVIEVPFHKSLLGDDRFVAENSDALREALRATISGENCGEFLENMSELSSVRLTKTQMLVSTQCWMDAYNAGLGYWVVNALPPYDPTLITTDASGVAQESIIFSTQKVRGLEDCWSLDVWTWNGTRFIHTESSFSGMREELVILEGTWSLPTIVSDVFQVGGFESNANQGQASAQYILGLLHSAGRGMPQDDRKAVEWFQKAAKQRHADAKIMLDLMSGTGRKLEQNRQKACQRWHTASQWGDDPAIIAYEKICVSSSKNKQK